MVSVFPISDVVIEFHQKRVRMRGAIKKRYKDSWSLIVDSGRRKNLETGTAETCRDYKRAVYWGFVEPTNLAFEGWMKDWLETNIRPTKKQRTYETDRHVIKRHLNPVFGSRFLQKISAVDIQGYCANSKLPVATLQQHHAILNRAMTDAAKQDLIKRNPAALVSNKPRRSDRYESSMINCRDGDEARLFLDIADSLADAIDP